MSNSEILLIVLLAAAILKLLYSSWDQFKSAGASPWKKKSNKINSTKKISNEDVSAELANKQPKFDFYKDAEFVNKDCEDLESFVINTDINEFDLRKLTDLNQINLSIPKGWYPLTIQLVNELYNNGWDKKVSCIKDKYASLRFHFLSSNKKLHEIVEKYEEMSRFVCEKCEERAEKRHYNGWEYAYCRRHYMEMKGVVFIEENGFNLDNSFYSWEKIRNASLKNKDWNGKYSTLIFELKNGPADERKLFIDRDSIGFGAFLNNLPKTFKDLDYDYITNNYSSIQFCEICGYEAAFFGICECCENESWNRYQDDLKAKPEERKRYLVECQLKWAIDGGEKYEAKENNYLKNPNHQILFTQKELDEFKNY